jgi:hypothetical protein
VKGAVGCKHAGGVAVVVFSYERPAMPFCQRCAVAPWLEVVVVETFCVACGRADDAIGLFVCAGCADEQRHLWDAEFGVGGHVTRKGDR